MRLIKITYVKITPESADMGDFSETGIDREIECDVDEYYIEEYGSVHSAVVNRAVNLIGIYSQSVEPSSSEYHRGIWYTETEGSVNYRTGEITQYSFHLDGFTEPESRDIFEELTKKR